MKNVLATMLFMLIVSSAGSAFAGGPVVVVPQDGPMPICLNHPGKPPCPQDGPMPLCNPWNQQFCPAVK